VVLAIAVPVRVDNALRVWMEAAGRQQEEVVVPLVQVVAVPVVEGRNSTQQITVRLGRISEMERSKPIARSEDWQSFAVERHAKKARRTVWAMMP
jgi:hypothetical protein